MHRVLTPLCARVCVCVCARARACVCVRACVRRECDCACECAFAHACLLYNLLSPLPSLCPPLPCVRCILHCRCRDGTLTALNLLKTAWPQSATAVSRSLSDASSDGASGIPGSNDSTGVGGGGVAGGNRRMGSGLGRKPDQQLRRRALADLAVHQRALAAVSICGRPATNRWVSTAGRALL